MAVGTTADFNMTRNELCTLALRKVGALAEGEAVTAPQLADAIKALNMIIREEDSVGYHIWAIGPQPTTLTLVDDTFRYTSANGLATNIVELTKVSYRDAGGEDYPVDILTHKQFENISNKFETGCPRSVLLVEHRDLASRELIVVPTLTSVNTASGVVGTDALEYTCIRSHTADSKNKPVTGANYLLYWEQTGSGGGVWATDTQYTAAQHLRYWYKRPLFDFDLSTDNPDMPQSWTRTLLYRLCSDLGDDYGVALDERTWLSQKANRAGNRTFRNTQTEETTDVHNKVDYY